MPGESAAKRVLPTIIQAARSLPEIEFRLAGRVRDAACLGHGLPANVKLVGFLEKDKLSLLYQGARMIVSASECYETFGMSVAEAMLHVRPVVVSRIGVFPEFVQDGVTGLLFEPGNAADLAAKIRYLWDRPDVCRRMGQAGREKALREYSPEKYYERLMAVYKKAIELGPGGPRRGRKSE